VVLPEEEGCCGGLSHHLGQHDEARAFARRNIIAWERVAQAGPLDAILTTTSGCGTEMKDYGHLLRDDPVFAQRAERISGYIMDISEFLANRIDIGAPSTWSDIRVAYHAPCSLQHGQGVNDEPRQLLREAGFTVVDIPEGHICCGSAGTYNILQPGISDELRSRKLANIASVKADCVVTDNIGCMTHLKDAGTTPIVHTVELVNWAYGGTCPSELSHLSDRVRRMEDIFKEKALVPVEPEAKKRNLLLYLMGFDRYR
jgi:glycolate oxidase iron-sulfur subunit